MIAVQFGKNEESLKYGSRVLGTKNEFDLCKEIAEAAAKGSDTVIVYKPGADTVLLKLKIEDFKL